MPAVALTPPYSILAKRQGYRDLVHTGDVIGVSPTTALVTTKEKLEREPQKIRRAIRAVMRAVEFAKTRRVEMIQFIVRQYKMEREVADSIYDALMDTLNPTLWLTDQGSAGGAESHRRAEQDEAGGETGGCGGLQPRQANGQRSDSLVPLRKFAASFDVIPEFQKVWMPVFTGMTARWL
jgi:hypothetical protein